MWQQQKQQDCYLRLIVQHVVRIDVVVYPPLLRVAFVRPMCCSFLGLFVDSCPHRLFECFPWWLAVVMVMANHVPFHEIL